MDIGCVVADKGFDSESNHTFVHKIGADSVIPLRYRQPYLKRKVTIGEIVAQFSKGKIQQEIYR